MAITTPTTGAGLFASRSALEFFGAFLQAFVHVAFGFGWIVVIILLTQVAHADDIAFEPTLKTSVEVSGEQITLGDLFDNAGDLASVALAPSPEPGDQVSLRADYVASRAASAGLRWVNPKGLTRVAVRRASQEIGAAEITAALREALRPQATYDDLDVMLSNPALTLHAAVDQQVELQIDVLQFDPLSGRFSGALRAYPGGPKISVAGRTVDVVEAPTLTRSVDRGQIIRSSDIVLKRMPSARLPHGALRDAGAVVGQAAKRRLSPGAPIRHNDIEAPTVVAKGSIVTIVYEQPGLRLTVLGRAQENAGHNETLSVVNLQSHRTVQGIAQGPNTVTVLSPFGLAGLN